MISNTAMVTACTFHIVFPSQLEFGWFGSVTMVQHATQYTITPSNLCFNSIYRDTACYAIYNIARLSVCTKQGSKSRECRGDRAGTLQHIGGAASRTFSA